MADFLSIFDFGYGRDLTKDDSFYDEVSRVQSRITSEIAPSNVGSGESTANTELVDGYLQSSNFVTGASGSGWRLGPTLAEFNDVTVRGTLVATTGSIGGFDIGTDYLR